VAIETAGSWHHLAVELVQEQGRWTTDITKDSRETTYLFQQLVISGFAEYCNSDRHRTDKLFV